MNKLLEEYKTKRADIEKNLEQFKNLDEEGMYNEFLFCLLTPQSNAQRCWEAVREIGEIKNPDINRITKTLSKRTRFHHTKAKRIIEAKKIFRKILPILKNKEVQKIRYELAETVNGYGLKEASHFLRNIGLSNNQIAILDRHILKNLYKYALINNQKIKSQKHYLEIEKIFLDFANKNKIPSDHLDILWWSQENGELFK